MHVAHAQPGSVTRCRSICSLEARWSQDSCCRPHSRPPRPAGWLVVVPLAVGFVLSRAVAEPLWGFAETVNPLVGGWAGLA